MSDPKLPDQRKGHWEVVPAPPLFLTETGSMECYCLGFRHWHAIHSEDDLPAVYREFQKRWVWDE